MSIKLISLNIEGHKHLEKRVLPFLKNQQADIICLQEVFEVDLPTLEKNLNMNAVFVPMSNVVDPSVHVPDVLGKIGLAMLSKKNFLKVNRHLYVGKESKLPRFFYRKNPNAMNRCLLTAQIKNQNQIYQIATTHFTWSKHGAANFQQQRHLNKLLKVLNKYPEIVLCGDFNAPRGKKTFSRLAARYQDNIPTDITTTLDPNLHKAGKLEFVVDALFSSPKYQIKNVEIVGGVSDHKAIVATITKQN